MYKLHVSLNESEFMELTSMAMGIDGWPKGSKQHAIYSCLLKIKRSCLHQCSDEQKAYLAKVHKAIRASFGEPSVERGMLQGGFQAMMQRISESLEKEEDQE